MKSARVFASVMSDHSLPVGIVKRDDEASLLRDPRDELVHPSP